ncbi:hypothetical protein ADJ70_03565 [Olsenella sp. oral taxon 807]|nr:hypothetical protein ADJ70_03565 [Olsenella sp. oral taxon 807]
MPAMGGHARLAAPTAGLVAGLTCRRPADLGHVAELRTSDLPWAHAGREAEAAGYPRLAT